MSSVELARRLGTRQPTAWLIKHKLMAAMAAREAEKPKLAGRVEIDDAYLGGQRAGGMGPGAAGAEQVPERVQHLAQRRPAAPTAAPCGRQQGLDQRKLRVGDVGCVPPTRAVMLMASGSSPHRS